MGISSRRHRNGESAPEGERRLVQMGRIPDADERQTRRLYGAAAVWMARAARTRPPNDRGGTQRIVVGSPNPRATAADGAASKATAARLAASLSAASAHIARGGVSAPRADSFLPVRIRAREGAKARR